MDSLVFTRKEMQEITGLSLPTIDALARRAQNPLPHIRVGARVLFPADAVRRWLLDETERTAEHGRPV